MIELALIVLLAFACRIIGRLRRQVRAANRLIDLHDAYRQARR